MKQSKQRARICHFLPNAAARTAARIAVQINGNEFPTQLTAPTAPGQSRLPGDSSPRYTYRAEDCDMNRTLACAPDNQRLRRYWGSTSHEAAGFPPQTPFR